MPRSGGHWAQRNRTRRNHLDSGHDTGLDTSGFGTVSGTEDLTSRPAAGALLGARGLRTRPAPRTRTEHAAAKTISRIDPAVVASAAADPAVLVTLNSDLRLSLGALARDAGATFAASYTVAVLATGYIELHPDADDPRRHPRPGLPSVTVDPRDRLRITRGVQHRLAVPVGAKTLVTYRPEDDSLRLLNIAAFLDAIEATIALSAPELPDGP